MQRMAAHLVPEKNSIDIGLIVGDAAASTHFYGDVLGLEFVENMATPWGEMHRFRFGESWVKLLAADGRGLAQTTGELDASLGFRYLTFQVENIEEIWERMVADGVRVYRPLASVGTKGLMMAMVFDPDGNIVELVRRPYAARIGAPPDEA
jgi:catechol 2,3-dioxygenase-like lactoylglutathione lyase family enzyme